MLDEIKKTYLQYANNIQNWKTMNKNELANLYIDNEHDDLKRNWYFSALMLRYWNVVLKFIRDSKFLHLDDDDFTSWLSESISIALKYRRWRDPSFSISKDPNGPDKIINRCIFSTRMRYYQYYNWSSRCINYGPASFESIDRQIELYGDSAEALTQNHDTVEISSADELIHYFINKHDIITAIILDFIAFQFSMKLTMRTLSRDLNIFLTNNSNYKDYFIKRYNVDEMLFDAQYNSLKSIVSSKKTSLLIKDILDKCRKNRNVLETLGGSN